VSLINKMLRDLDERQATEAERAGLAGRVRALPPARRFPWSRVVLVLAGAAAGAAGLWLLLDSQGMAPVTPNVRPASAVAPIPSPAVMPELPAQVFAMPALVVPMPNEERESTASAETASKPSPVSVESLQLDVKLSQLPVQRSEAAKPGASAGRSIGDTDTAAIDKHPHDAPAGNVAEPEYRKAMAAFRQGRASEAMAGFQAALRLDARHVAARQAMLSQLMEQQRWPEAQTLAAEGLALDAAQPGWAMILARLQVEQGQLADAEGTLAHHATQGARSADYLAFHALLLQKLQRSKEAVEQFRAAAALRPDEGRWWYGLGMALEADRRPIEAREAFRQARDAGNLPAELAATLDQRLR
jgi:MSHA biogenesis protein MshN